MRPLARTSAMVKLLALCSLMGVVLFMGELYTLPATLLQSNLSDFFDYSPPSTSTPPSFPSPSLSSSSSSFPQASPSSSSSTSDSSLSGEEEPSASPSSTPAILTPMEPSPSVSMSPAPAESSASPTAGTMVEPAAMDRSDFNTSASPSPMVTESSASPTTTALVPSLSSPEATSTADTDVSPSVSPSPMEGGPWSWPSASPMLPSDVEASPSALPSPAEEPQTRVQVPEEYQHVMEEWSHLTNETLDVLAMMLSQRNDKIRRYANASKEAHTTLYGIDYRLPFVLKNIRKNLGPDWNITVFHSPVNAKWIRSLPEVQEVGAQLTMNLPVNFTYENYGQWLLKVDYWKLIKADHVLMFQTDSCLCANTPFKVIDFMDYDYVGAPWGHWLNTCGNGGLSLRRVSKMIEALQNCRDPGDYVYEDSYFCGCFYHIDIKLANWTISRYFSAETFWTETTVGLHKPGAYYGNSGDRVYARCPEAYEVLADKRLPPNKQE